MTCKPRPISGNLPFDAIAKDYNRYCDRIVGSGKGLLSKLFFAIGGQSNASGRGIVAGGETPSSLVTMLGNDYVVKQASEPIDDWTGQVDAISDDNTVPLANMHSFQLKAAKDLNRTVGLIPCAKGGSGITNWLPTADKTDRSTLFGSMQHRVLTAGGLSAFWWHGHEANSVDSKDVYGQRWFALINELRLHIADQPVIYAQLGKHATALNNTQQNQASQFQSIYETGYATDSLVAGSPVIDSDFVNDTWSAGLPPGWIVLNGDVNNFIEQTSDGLHFVCDGSQTLGIEFAGALDGASEFLIEIDMADIVSNGVTARGTTQFATYAAQSFFHDVFTSTGTSLQLFRSASGQQNEVTIRSIKVRPYTSGEKWEPIDRHHMVVTFDLPLIDIIHLDQTGQIELGRRIGLATRQHVLGESVNGTGPRLIPSGAFTHPSGDKSKVNVTFDSDISNGGGTDYNGQFRVFDNAVEMTVSSAVVDLGDSESVLITMTATAAGTVTVSYGDVVASGTGVTLNDVVKDSDLMPAPQFSLQTVV